MKKRGFTLIELLAVIVILAIIALIATPIILSMINNARKSAAKSTAYGFIQAIDNNNGFADSDITGYTKIEDGAYQVSDINVSMKGKKPESGIVDIDKGKVDDATLCIDGYGVHYDGKEATVSGSCTTENVLYKESILNGAVPTLKTDMIPVTISNDGTVKKADLYSKWYSYKNKKWANAVVLTDSTTYNAGDTIPENKIKAYYVWIPRYRYQLFSSSTPIEIQITFENKTTSKSTNTTVGEYLTHPAFTYGTAELQGFWVGKFETSVVTTDTCYTTANMTNCNKEITDSRIKPNVKSLRHQQVVNQYKTSLNVSNSSRMMKNDEWGAVAYLSHSKYGKNSEIRINNNSNKITGCGASANDAAESSTCQIVYGSNVSSYPQSTTGNITGIFDMSGGSTEYMMAVRSDPDGNPYSGKHNAWNSGFNGNFCYPDEATETAGGDPTITSLTTGTNFPAAKDYNLYYNTGGSNITGNTGCNSSKCYGHAFTETAGWYSDTANFVILKSPWIVRGGRSGIGANAGIFAYNNNYGRAIDATSFRVVVPTT